MALATSIFVAGCNKDENLVSPTNTTNAQSPALEEAPEYASCPTSILPANTRCPEDMPCGCQTVSGLGARKAAYIDDGRAAGISEVDIRDFLGKAGLETANMNPFGYPYGDVYPNRPETPNTIRDRKKTGYAANGGAIKQNVYVIAATISGFHNTVVSNVVFNPNIRTSNGYQAGDWLPSPCPANQRCWNEVVDELNRDRQSDMKSFVQSRNRLRVVFGNIPAGAYNQGDDPWSRMHRGGASYITLNFIDRGAVGNPISGVEPGGTDVVNVRLDALRIKSPTQGLGSYVVDGGWQHRGPNGDVGAKNDTRRYILATKWIENRLLNGHTRSNVRFWVNVTNI